MLESGVYYFREGLQSKYRQCLGSDLDLNRVFMVEAGPRSSRTRIDINQKPFARLGSNFFGSFINVFQTHNDVCLMLLIASLTSCTL